MIELVGQYPSVGQAGQDIEEGELLALGFRTAHWFIERDFAEAGMDVLPAARRELYNLQRLSKCW